MNNIVAQKNKPLLTIGLLWHSLHSDNFGVGALSQSQISICTEAADAIGVDLRFYVFGTKGGSSYGTEDFRINIGSRISVKEILTGRSRFVEEISQCDLVLDIGEGDSFTDIYGIRRYIFFILTKIVVLAKKIPLILSPQTIGPFKGWFTRWLAVKVMNRCRLVLARDYLSAGYLKSCGVNSSCAEFIDVAFKLPFDRQEKVDNNRVRVGINVSGLLFSGGYSGDNQFGLALDYPMLMRNIVGKLAIRPEYDIWLIPHVIPDDLPRDDDRIACAILKKEFPSVNLAPSFRSPSEAKSFISGMDFVTGARMHACIAAFSSGVPVVPIAYSRKFNGLFSTLGYKWVADATKETLEGAENIIFDGLDRRLELAADIALGNEFAKNKLDEYTRILSDVFKQVVQK